MSGQLPVSRKTFPTSGLQHYVATVQNRGPSDVVECLHDIRLVRPPEGPAEQTADDRHSGELGDRVLRISAASPRQPNWPWQFLVGATQNHARGYHAGRLCAVL